MSQQYINVGDAPNDGLGDPIRTAFQKTNTNFTQLFSATGNIANVITVTGDGISVTGNISTGNYFIGNGAFLTGVAASYGNSNVANYLPTYTGNLSANVISAVGNISGNYFIGNGAFLTGISTGNGNANTGNVTFNNINIIGDGNLNLQPDPANSSAYLNIYLTTGPDIHIAGNGENVIIGRDDSANVTVGVDGNVTIQASTGNAQVWNFGSDGTLMLPNQSTIQAYNNVQTYLNSVDNGVVQINAFDPSNNLVSYFVADGTSNIAMIGTADPVTEAGYQWIFDQYGNLTAPGVISAGGNIYANDTVFTNNVMSGGGVLRLYANPTEPDLVWTINNDGYPAGINNSAFVGPLSDDIHVGEIFLQATTGNAILTFAGPNNDPFSNAFSVISDGGNIIMATTPDGSTLHLSTFDTDGNLTVDNDVIANTVYGNLFVGTFLGNVTGNLVVTGSNTQVLYNDNGNVGASAGFTFNSASNVLTTSGNISTTGNIISLTVNTSGNISATGNVYGNHIVANLGVTAGANIRSDRGVYGNTGVYANSIISASGNIITAGYFIGNIQGSVANAVYATSAGNATYANTSGNATYANDSGNASYANTAGNATTATTATTANTVTGSAQANITSVGTLTSLTITTTNSNIATPGSTVVNNGFFKLPSYTTAEIGNLTGMTGGEMVYNSTLQKIQAYQANATGSVTWVSLSVSTYQ